MSVNVAMKRDPKAWHFEVELDTTNNQQWKVTSDGVESVKGTPWAKEAHFFVALQEYNRMVAQPTVDERTGGDLHANAVRLGDALAAALLTASDLQHLCDASGQDGLPPMVTIESNDDVVLSLPWELLRLNGEFAVREGRIDLVRTVPAVEEDPPTLTPPDRPVRVVVHVAAPDEDGQGKLDYEGESYRLLRALYEHCEVRFTELGTIQDLVTAVATSIPLGIHFSGHGMPGGLQLEDEEGRGELISIQELLQKIRSCGPGVFPRFFYLSSCHGNDPARPAANEPGSSISAAHLHREGVTQVIGYSGPIVDTLSTLAEATVYRALAAGWLTRVGMRQARVALAHRPDDIGQEVYQSEAVQRCLEAFPFAWAQLVLYHRGADYPLSTAFQAQHFQAQEAALQRVFEGSDKRQILTIGFIGRRRELHQFRRGCREGKKVFVFQGLGGLGKSTLAFQALPVLTENGEYPLLTFWCREYEDAENQAQALMEQLSEFAQELLGEEWLKVVQVVDRMAEATEAERFRGFLQALLQRVGRLVVYLDNLESLLHGPEDEDPEAFGNWRSQDLATIWQLLKEESGNYLSVVASCRYRHSSFEEETIHVGEMGDHALFRMMGWFDTLRRFSIVNRAKLVDRLHGHPRAVEFLEDLLRPALKQWEDRHGEWKAPTEPAGVEQEWQALIEPALPQVEEKLQQNLLLDALWQRVLDEQSRRMLFRMTVLRRPWDWDLMMQLGEPGAETAEAERTAGHLRETSLVGEVRVWRKDRWEHLFQVHSMTARFVAQQFDEKSAVALRLETCERAGTYLEGLARTSTYLEVHRDAGLYLFQCGEFSRADELLGKASKFLQERGHVRAGIALVVPFEQVEVLCKLSPKCQCRLLITVGNAHYRLGQVETAIDYYKRALIISKETCDRQAEGINQGNLGNAYAALSQVETAIDYYKQALAISREIGDRQGEGARLGNLGTAYYARGQVEEAINYFKQALVILQELGDRQAESRQLGNLGLAYANQGHVQTGIDYYLQALAISREIGDRRGEGSCLGQLGSAYYRLKELPTAIDYYHQALVISREIGDRQGEGIHHGNLGMAYADLGQMKKAIEYLEQALVISRETGHRQGEGNYLGNLGMAYADLGQMKKAVECCQLGLKISREIGYRYGEGHHLFNLGSLYYRLGQVEKARRYAQEALAIAQEIQFPYLEKAVLDVLKMLG